MAPGATGPVGPPYKLKPGQAVKAEVLTLPIEAQFKELVTLLIADVSGASTKDDRPVSPGNSARANSMAKHKGLFASCEAVYALSLRVSAEIELYELTWPWLQPMSRISGCVSAK